MKTKVLMVGNNQETRSLLGPILKSMGFDFLDADGRRRALIVLTENTLIDFLVMDSDATNPDEAEDIIHDARNIFGKAIYILVVNTTPGAEHIHYRMLGADDTLSKPFSLIDFCRAVGSVKKALERVAA